jgi:mannose-6-phosphate isomerase-like protein (cupin superfamily)
MLIKDIQNCTYFTALDNSTLCELLHPANEPEDFALRCSIAHAIVKPGEKTRAHRLKTAAEVYYILEGEGIMYIDENLQQSIPGRPFTSHLTRSNIFTTRVASPI